MDRLPVFSVVLSLTLCLATASIRAETVADPTRGKQLYERKCGRCHFLYEPERYSPEEWNVWVQVMASESGLDEDGAADMLSYLQSESSEREDREGYVPTGVNLGGYMYTEYFTHPDKANTFDIHYLALTLAGQINRSMSFAGEFELEHGGAEGKNTFVELAYIDYRIKGWSGVRVGALLAPFNRFDELHDPLKNQLVTRPQSARELGVSAWKDVGINLYSGARLSESLFLDFDLYALNGLGAGSRLRSSRQYRDNNNSKSLGLRVSGVWNDMVEVGVSGYNGKWDDDDLYSATLIGAHLMISNPLVDILAEYTGGTSSNPDSVAEGEMTGWFIQFSHVFQNRFRPIVRIGGLDYLDPMDGLGRSPTDKQLTEVSLGLSIYPTVNTAIKAEYIMFRDGDRTGGDKLNQLALQSAVLF